MATLEERVEQLEKIVREQAQFIARLKTALGGADTNVATDRELDSQWGDPQVKLVPKTWTAGGVVKGQKFSTCPADFLDVLAETMDYFAEKNDAKGAKDSKDRPLSYYDRKNARFARGWAKRLRSGWAPPDAPNFGGASANGSANGSANPFAQNGASANPFGGGGIGFGLGASRAALPEMPPTPPSSSPLPASHEDDDISFNFGANEKSTSTQSEEQDEEELPLV